MPRSARTVRVIHVSDSHLGFDLPIRPRTTAEGRLRPRRGEDFFANLERAFDYAHQVKADAVIHTGDVFFRSKLPPAIVDRAYGCLTRFAERGIPLVILPGNHERSRMPPSLLLRHQHIHVLDRPRAVRLEGARGSLEVVGFPYRKDARAALLELVVDAGPRGADACLLAVHQAIEGSWVGASAERGVRFERQPDVIARDGVPGCFHAVLAGHIHRRQVLRVGARRDVPAIHCGSVERTSAQELYEPKGFVDLSITVDRRGRRSAAPRFVPLPARPWRRLDLDDGLSTATALSVARREVASSGRHTYVRLRAGERLLGPLSRARLWERAPDWVVVDLLPLGGRDDGRAPLSAREGAPGYSSPVRSPSSSATSASISSGVR
jgi:exonuclease SbcD